METRKVQRTGTSTFVVSIPKNWATKHEIKSGSILYITQGDNGNLMLSAEKSKKNTAIKLDIGDTEGEPLIRDIIACYLNGYKTIEVNSNKMSPNQKQDIRQIVNKLIGPEILDESSNRVVIQDLLNSEELQAEKALKRMKIMTRSMINDSINALLNKNQDLALDVIQRDNEVDRMNLLVSRQFSEILRSGQITQENKNIMAFFYFMQAASSLERIADHAAKIAELPGEKHYEVPQDLAEYLSGFMPTLGDLLDGSISALLQNDSDKANKLITNIKKIEKDPGMTINSANVKDKGELVIRLVVISSFERILDYIVNIGEQAINLKNATL